VDREKNVVERNVTILNFTFTELLSNTFFFVSAY